VINRLKARSAEKEETSVAKNGWLNNLFPRQQITRQQKRNWWKRCFQCSVLHLIKAKHIHKRPTLPLARDVTQGFSLIGCSGKRTLVVSLNRLDTTMN
jgi:hypothetical protein